MFEPDDSISGVSDPGYINLRNAARLTLPCAFRGHSATAM